MRQAAPNRTALHLLAIGVSVMLLAAACGGDDGSSTPTAVYGGTLIFGLEAETSDGWNPATTQCAVSCHTVMRAIFDPLVLNDSDGVPQPYLLESFDANEDFTVWTFRMRPGIKFHDGTPADAHALATHFQNLLSGALAGQTLRRLDGWEVIDDLTLELRSSVPFAGLPGGLTGQLGYLPAPRQYADPDGAANPVGTGPFVFKSWIPDAELVVERNPDYWRTDAEGRAVPYLDRIVFQPIVESDSRKLALQLGDINATHSDNGLDFDDYRENFDTVEERSFLETHHLLINNASRPSTTSVPGGHSPTAPTTRPTTCCAPRATSTSPTVRSRRTHPVTWPTPGSPATTSKPVALSGHRSPTRARSNSAPPAIRSTGRPPSCSPRCGATAASTSRSPKSTREP